MISKLLAAGAVALALSQVGTAHAASIVRDGTFAEGASAGSFTTVAKNGTIGAWTVTKGSVDLIGSYWEQTPAGGYTIDLDGNSPGAISESVTLAKGDYELSFYVSGNTDGGSNKKKLDVQLGSFINEVLPVNATGATHADMGYDEVDYFFSVTSATTTTLSFSSLDAASSKWGAVIGDVQINAVAVPEPGSLVLMLAGLGVLGTVARRRGRTN